MGNLDKCFSRLAMKYWEKGYGVMPVGRPKTARSTQEDADKNTKAGLIKDWDIHCTRLMAEDLLSTWIEQHPKRNIGLPCGVANNIIAVDIDIDDSGIQDIIPISPVIRVGNPKRQTRFFRYPKGTVSNFDFTGFDKDQPHEDSSKIVSIISSGKFTVIEGWHEKHGKYFTYPNKTLLDTSIDYLPEYTDSWHEELFKYISVRCPVRNGIEKTGANGGRNDRHKAVVCRILYDTGNTQKAISEILEVDEKEAKPLFTDKSEGYSAKNEAERVRNATRFVAGMYKKITTDKNFLPEIASPLPIMEIDKFVKPKSTHIDPEYPKSGLIYEYMKVCEKTDRRYIPSIWLANALGLASVAMAHRFKATYRGFTVTSNMYNLVIAESGIGKDAPQKLTERLLEGTKLLGAASYKSGVALVANFPKQRARLDICDEFSRVLKAMNGTQVHQSEMADIYPALHSRANGIYTCSFALSYKLQGLATRLVQPSLTIVGSTTKEGFLDAISKHNTEKGFLPRCQIFRQPRAELKPMTIEESSSVSCDISKVEKALSEILSVKKQFEDSMYEATGEETRPENSEKWYRLAEIPKSERATQIALDYESDCDKKRGANGWERAFFARFNEQALKYALLFAVCDDSMRIEEMHMQDAIKLVQTNWSNDLELFGLANAGNQQDVVILNMVAYIKEHGFCTPQDLRSRYWTAMGGKRNFYDALSILIDSGEIIEFEEKQASGHRKKFLTIKNAKIL